MMHWLRNLDGLLRGERTRAEMLRSGNFELPLTTFIPMAIVLGAAYGFFMGWYSVASPRDARWAQMLSSMVKLPALFLLTLLVTFPSLYVFNALVGTRLTFLASLRLLMAAIVITLAVAASLGPIVAFFTLSTTSYSFMVVLNVLTLGLSGIIGLGFLLTTLRKMSPEARIYEQVEGAPQAPESAGSANLIFQVWVIIFGLVGAQMAWLLRPFIGHPDMKWQFVRVREGNFFQSFADHISRLLGM